jgi:hypothetical protein
VIPVEEERIRGQQTGQQLPVLWSTVDKEEVSKKEESSMGGGKHYKKKAL